MDFGFIIGVFGGICAGALAIAVAFRARRTLPHWSFMAGMAALAAESVFAGLSSRATNLEGRGHWESLQLLSMSFVPGAWLVFSLSYARGNYREFLKRWQLAVIVAVAAPVGLALFFHEDLITFIGQTSQGAPWIMGLSEPGIVLHCLLVLGAVLVLMNLERTYREAVGTMRWRIKFMILGVGVLFAVRAYSSSQALLYHAAHLSLQTVNSGALAISCVLMIRTLIRTGHFEVSIYPSHSALYNSFTVLLAGIYLVIVGALAKLFTLLGGDDYFEAKAFLILLALVGLSLLLLSDRVRANTKNFISRNFQRPEYDYRRVWQSFTEKTARCVDQTSLCEAVARLVSEVFHALSVSVWLTDEGKPRLTFAASTSLLSNHGEQTRLAAEDASELIRALEKHPKPVDLEMARGNWAEALRGLQPGEFSNGGHRVCVPLTAGGEVVGVIILGDRIGGAPYSGQDLELVKAVSDQTAVGLLNLRLSEKVSRGRQLEAFQAMSAFFVHDLKNTASTLSLMLQNLPVHYENAAFREDALRGISRTVEHLQELISRLNMLRHELQVDAVECDLNELVSDTLQGQDQSGGLQIVKELASLPKIKVDPAQIKRVLTNLILNARDASEAGGRIRVETRRSNGWAVLAVADAGCGMTSEFVQKRLFRPFQTTKGSGIGIGMFQCKMIVEAHHGQIEVESEPGKGTAFRVLLPI